MCNHLETSKKFIEEITHQAYPLIELQFIQLFAEENDWFVEDLLSKLQNEFRSLITCEKTMVFPSILKVFNKEKSEDGSAPNVMEMMNITRNKESKMTLLIEELKTYLIMNAQVFQYNELKYLVQLFEQMFVPLKLKWNKMIDQRSESCACFKLYTLNTINQNQL